MYDGMFAAATLELPNCLYKNSKFLFYSSVQIREIHKDTVMSCNKIYIFKVMKLCEFCFQDRYFS